MHANVEFSNFNFICRFCLTEIGFLNVGLFTEEDKTQANIGGCDYNSRSEGLKEMVKLCIGIDISPQDNLPQSMCTQCLDKLLQCNKFRLDSFNAEKILKNALLIHKIIRFGAQEKYDANANDGCNNEEEEHKMEIEDELSSISSGATDLDEHEIIKSRTPDSGQQINDNCKSNTSNAAINSMKSVKTKIGERRILKHGIQKRIGDKTDCISVESYQTSKMQESVLNSESDVTTDSTDRFETETENSFMPEGELAENIEAESMSFLNERFQTSEMQESVLNDEYAVDIIRGNTEVDENVNPEIEVISDISQLNERKSTLRKRYECLDCKKKFIHETDYKKHIKIGHQRHPNKSTNYSKYVKKKKIIKKKDIACRLCKKQFKKEEGLMIHYRFDHQSDNHYKCDLCPKVFIMFKCWQRHVEAKTCYMNKNSCRLCGKRCLTEFKFKTHYRMRHPGCIPYKCDKCGEIFSNSKSLNNHKETTDELSASFEWYAEYEAELPYDF